MLDAVSNLSAALATCRTAIRECQVAVAASFTQLKTTTNSVMVEIKELRQAEVSSLRAEMKKDNDNRSQKDAHITSPINELGFPNLHSNTEAIIFKDVKTVMLLNTTTEVFLHSQFQYQTLHYWLHMLDHDKTIQIDNTTGNFIAAQDDKIVFAPVSPVSSEALFSDSKIGLSCAFASGINLEKHKGYGFNQEPKQYTLTYVNILGCGTGTQIRQKLVYMEYVCARVILGSKLVNVPANILTPWSLTKETLKIASMDKDVLVAAIFDVDHYKGLKLCSYLRIVADSANTPSFIYFCCKSSNAELKVKWDLVGKSFTIDGGGYIIINGPEFSLDEMNYDMGSSRAIRGTAIVAITTSMVEVHSAATICEIMISGTGTRHGDMVTVLKGNALGLVQVRLLHADALVSICRQNIEHFIALATLTRTCIVVLTLSLAGCFTISNYLVAAHPKSTLEAQQANPFTWIFECQRMSQFISPVVHCKQSLCTMLYYLLQEFFRCPQRSYVHNGGHGQPQPENSTLVFDPGGALIVIAMFTWEIPMLHPSRLELVLNITDYARVFHRAFIIFIFDPGGCGKVRQRNKLDLGDKVSFKGGSIVDNLYTFSLQ